MYPAPAVTRADVGTQARPNIGINIAALARAESYTDDEFPFPSFSEPVQRPVPVPDSIRLGCAAPALQSPKNSVAPLVSAPTAPDYSVNLHRLKTVFEGPGNVNGCQHYLFQSEDFNDRKPVESGPSDNTQAGGATSVCAVPVSSAATSSCGPCTSAASGGAAALPVSIPALSDLLPRPSVLSEL